MTEPRIYNDPINDEVIYFHSDARQSTIDALDFNGEWYVVREILRNWGYIIIENPTKN